MTQYGPDYYHLNFGDRPLPLAEIKARGADFVILKYSQGTSYGDWAVTEGARVRQAGLVLGGYHMLDGDSPSSGAQQAAYFLGKLKPQPGDMVPIVDFEGSGQGQASLTTYKAKLIDFVKAVHAAGFEVMLYGHATVKAAFADWRASGADYWWVPGSQPWSDVGSRGPDLWQYQPYTLPAGYPHNFRGDGAREDASKVLTALPLIANPQEDDVTGDEILAGMKAYNQGDPAPKDGPALVAYKALQNAEKRGAKAASGGSTIDPAMFATVDHEHDLKGRAV